MLVVVITGWVLRLRRRLYDTRWFLLLCTWFAPAGFLAVLFGWTTTEVGRQPWTVYRLLRTADSVTPALSGGDVLASLLFYAVVYLVIYPTGIAYMTRLVRRGLRDEEVGKTPVESGRPRSPFALSRRPRPAEAGRP